MSVRIVSRLPGRLRLRGEDLRVSAANQALCRELLGWEGVVSAEGNPTTGGILLRYDVGHIDTEAMEAMVAARVDRATASVSVSEPKPDAMLWRMNRYAKWGMLGSLTGTVAALAVGKKLHAAFGVAHLAFLLVHLSNHRNKLLK